MNMIRLIQISGCQISRFRPRKSGEIEQTHRVHPYLKTTKYHMQDFPSTRCAKLTSHYFSDRMFRIKSSYGRYNLLIGTK